LGRIKVLSGRKHSPSLIVVRQLVELSLHF
jgi:hypothetical protein